MSDFEGIEYTIGLNNVLGDETLLQEILVMFYQEHHQDGDKLRLALRNQDIEKAKDIAHTLKGVACSVGAMSLYETTKILDHAIKEKPTQSHENLLSNLLAELNIVTKGIALRLNVD